MSQKAVRLLACLLIIGLMSNGMMPLLPASQAAASSAPGTFTPIRVNAGGGAYTDSAGNAWSADTGFSGGGTYATTAAIAGTADQPLYQTERTGQNGGGFSYSFPVPNGTYAVMLKFAEVYWTTAGSRVFNVAINGQTVLSNFDILAAAAPKTALDKTFVVNATGGTLGISFTTLKDNAKVSAIQIVSTTDVAPTVAGTGPTAGATGVALNTPINVTFSEPMSQTTAQSAFALSPSVPGTFAWNSDGTVMTFTPSASLSANTTYTATVSTAAQSLAGTALASAKQWAFTTTASTVPPTATATPSVSASGSQTQFLGFYGATCPNYPTWATCRHGGIADTGFTTVLSGTNPADPSLLTLNPGVTGPATGTLAITSTGGDLYPTTAAPQDNALVLPIDGSAGAFSIGARMIGPINFTGGYQNGGIVLGLDATHNAKLVVSVSNGNNQPGVQFALQDPAQGGGFTGNPNNANPPLDPTTISTLDLFLTTDPVSHTLSALYRVNSNNPADVKLITTISWPASYFVNPLYGGLVTTNYGTPNSLRFTYDWFKVGPPVSGSNGGISFLGPTQVITSATIAGNGNFKYPTTMTFGPDGRLYVGTQYGRFFAYTLDANHNPTSVQEYTEIYNKPNHTCPLSQPDPPPDNCPLDTTVVGRQLLGLTFDPASTASNLILYVSHSDPRQFNNDPTNAKLIDTHSGTVTRLTLNGPGKTVNSNVDLITGLPRSRADHSTNGIHFGPDGWLYIAQADNTNEGAPSSYFGYLPGYYLSGTILRANVNQAGGFTPIDTRAITTTAAMTPYSGTFEIYATGLRNPYDLVWHSNGNLYSAVNAGNAGLGNTPGSADGCPNAPSADLVPSPPDLLERVTQGKYYGFPNPARGQCVWQNGTYLNLYNTTQIDPNYVPPMYTFGASEISMDGSMEYTANTFNGKLKGSLIIATYAGDHSVRRLKLSSDGKSVVDDSVITTLPAPLAVTQGSDGSIYVANIFGPSAIYVLTPNPAPPAICPAPGSDPAVTDSTGTGYLDQDKLDNGNDICNPSSTPPDFNHNGLSDLHDPDNDSGLIPLDTPDQNNQDQLQFDPSSGMSTTVPLTITFFAQTAGIQKSGFFGTLLPTGAGVTEADNNGHGFGLYQPGTRIRPNGVSGALTLVSTMGNDQGPINTQDNALQVGFNATQDFTVTTQMGSPFSGRTSPVTTTEEGGLFVGLDANNYVKLVLRRTGATQASLISAAKSGGAYQEALGQTTMPTVTLPFTGAVDLALVGHPAQGTLEVRYSVEPPTGGGTSVPWTTIGVLNTTNFPALSSFYVAPHCTGSSTPTSCVTLAGLQTTGPDVAFGFGYFDILK